MDGLVRRLRRKVRLSDEARESSRAKYTSDRDKVRETESALDAASRTLSALGHRFRFRLPIFNSSIGYSLPASGQRANYADTELQ
jgi:hypothetical protein